MFVINLICFFVSWIVGALNMNNNYFEILSYFLANDEDARIVYLIWYITYIILNCLLIYTVVKNDLTTIDNSNDSVSYRNVHCSFDTKNKLYRICTILYIPVNFIRLFAFFLLFLFDMTDYSNEHYIWTAVAMIDSTFLCFLLFVRRVCCRVYVHIHRWVYLVYMINAITIILQIVFISLLPASPDSTRGIFELMVAIFIGVDPIYQISDLYCDYRCNTTILQHETKHRCSHKIKLLQKTLWKNGNETNILLNNSLSSYDIQTHHRMILRNDARQGEKGDREEEGEGGGRGENGDFSLVIQ